MLEYPEQWKNMQTSLCHDWLTGMRGGERVLEILCNGFPNAPIYTLFCNKDSISDTIGTHPVRTSWLQSMPGIFKYYRNLLPLFPGAIEKIHTDPCDLIVSTSHCVAKGLKPPEGAKHLCYCFTPMRYAWTFFDEYFGGSILKKTLARQILPSMRKWDKDSCPRVDSFVAISKHVQKRIKKFYDRDSDIVYPPVDTDLWTPGEPGNDGYDLILSAMVPYKRVDLAVKAYNKLGYPLKVVGIGGELKNLEKIAKDNIEFLYWQPDEEIQKLFRGCRMLLFPGEEDFGIVPLEAQACGKPVVAYGKGGALETIVDGVSGVFFEEQTTESLLGGIEECAGKKWDPVKIRDNAEKFNNQNFINGMERVIGKLFS